MAIGQSQRQQKEYIASSQPRRRRLLHLPEGRRRFLRRGVSTCLQGSQRRIGSSPDPDARGGRRKGTPIHASILEDLTHETLMFFNSCEILG
ncbi:uncharacterized protein LOC112890177 isoform X2 [Panicum hallii]|uniref:uncharacterized protein LOC112890177 isoform X2 n=1 Tax=Panicum hallii TaxID=206008 RepID=UPI000DF4F154|nr:uncharacterized protein LOC112890177 isoform X2 [Panicum hallii]